jgi:hypothetical protein
MCTSPPDSESHDMCRSHVLGIPEPNSILVIGLLCRNSSPNVSRGRSCILCRFLRLFVTLCSLHSTSSNSEYEVRDTFDWFLGYVTTLFNCVACFAELQLWWQWRVWENVEGSSRDSLWVCRASQSAMTFSGHLPRTTVTMVAETSCVKVFQTVRNVWDNYGVSDAWRLHSLWLECKFAVEKSWVCPQESKQLKGGEDCVLVHNLKSLPILLRIMVNREREREREREACWKCSTYV